MVGGIDPHLQRFISIIIKYVKTINNSTELPKPQKEIMKMDGSM